MDTLENKRTPPAAPARTVAARPFFSSGGRGLFRDRPARALGRLLALAGTAGLVWIAGLGARELDQEEFPAPLLPYGLTYDGGNFWYSDIRAQQIVRVPLAGSTAPAARFSIGNRKIYGLRFNAWDGSLYLGVERGLLQISPLSGGVERSIPIPSIPRIAGAAFGPDLWYLLEKDSGIIHYYDPGLARVISSLRTGNADLRDLTYYRDRLWATDGKNGVILRYSPESGELTGSLVAPDNQLRGLTFADGQLWIVYRTRNSLLRVPIAESRHYIMSGEERFRLLVRIRFTLPPEGVEGRIIALQPPNTLAQQTSGVRAISNGWENRNFTASGDRVFELTRVVSGAVTLEYECTVRVRNIRFYFGADFEAQPESLRASPAAYYFDGDEAAFNQGDPATGLRAGVLSNPPAEELGDRLRASNLPVRWVREQRLAPRGETRPPEYRTRLEAYVRGAGWVPLDWPETDNAERRIFERSARNIEIYRQPDIQAAGESAVYLISNGVVSGARRMQAIPARVEVQASSR